MRSLFPLEIPAVRLPADRPPLDTRLSEWTTPPRRALPRAVHQGALKVLPDLRRANETAEVRRCAFAWQFQRSPDGVSAWINFGLGTGGLFHLLIHGRIEALIEMRKRRKLFAARPTLTGWILKSNISFFTG
jgi:hypothetical protein